MPLPCCDAKSELECGLYSWKFHEIFAAAVFRSFFQLRHCLWFWLWLWLHHRYWSAFFPYFSFLRCVISDGSRSCFLKLSTMGISWVRRFICICKLYMYWCKNLYFDWCTFYRNYIICHNRTNSETRNVDEYTMSMQGLNNRWCWNTRKPII